MAPMNWLSLAATSLVEGVFSLFFSPMLLAKPEIERTALDFKEFFPAV
jgi:hypothetical protein